MFDSLPDWILYPLYFWTFGGVFVLLFGSIFAFAKMWYEEGKLKGWRMHVLVILFGIFMTWLMRLPPF